MNSTKFKRSSLVLAVAAALCAGDAVYAQQMTLEEVVVTARKRAENLQEVPMAVSAFSSEQLKDMQIDSITDLERLASNVTLTEDSGLAAGLLTVFIRGIGNDPGLAAGVGVYVDDVYLNRTTGALLDVYDVERIELLKGPQGNLYGRNTIGGAIKYISREPTDETEVNLEVKLGEFNKRQLKASVSGALIEDKLYGSFGLMNDQRDGTQTNSFDGEEFNTRDVQAYRGSLIFKPSDELKIKLAADYSLDESTPIVANRVFVDEAALSGGSFVLTGGGFLTGFPSVYSEASDMSLPSDIDTISTEFTDGFKRFEIETKTLAATVEWELNDEWMLKSITANRWVDNVQPFDFDGSSQQFITTVNERQASDFSQELQLNFSGDNVQAVLGAFYLDSKQGTSTETHQYGRLLVTGYQHKLTPITDTGTGSKSLYGNLDWDFAEDWQLSLGGRYTQDSKSLVKESVTTKGGYAMAFHSAVPGVPFFVAPGQEAAAQAYPGVTMVIPGEPETVTTESVNVSKSWNDFSPSIKLSHHLNDETLVYAGLSTGFKAGGFQSTGDVAIAYDPETVSTYSLGLKTTLLEGTLRLNGEVFLNDYTDKQLSNITLIDDDLVQVTSNVGEVTTQGAELEVSWLPGIEGLMLGLNVGYLDTSVDSYEKADADTGVVTDIANTTELGFSPSWTTQARVAYEMGLADAGTLTLGADVGYRAKSYTRSPIDITDPLSERFEQKEHAIWNAMLAFRSSDEHWRLALEGKNLTDERVVVSGFDINIIASAGYNMPRTWALSVAYDY